MCNFLGSGSLQQKFGATDVPVLQLPVTAQFYWGSKGTYILKAWGQADPKVRRETSGSILAPLFTLFFLPLSLSYVNWASQEGCLFYLRLLLQSSDLSLFYAWAVPFVFQLLPFWIPFSYSRTSLVAQTVRHLSTMRETWVQALGWEDPLEREMAIHSSTIAWKIPWTEELAWLQSIGLQRVGHDWVTSLSLSLPYSSYLTILTKHVYMHINFSKYGLK